jgi:hypothetical protein
MGLLFPTEAKGGLAGDTVRTTSQPGRGSHSGET